MILIKAWIFSDLVSSCKKFTKVLKYKVELTSIDFSFSIFLSGAALYFKMTIYTEWGKRELQIVIEVDK